MSNGTSKPRRVLQLGGALIAVVALVASVTAIASAQTAQSRYFSGVITGPDFCIEDSLGGPRTYPFDQDRDGVADICSLPTTRRATVARQNAMELLALDFVARFGQLYSYECTDVRETYGSDERAKELLDECAAPREADAAGVPIPPVPASRTSPALATTWPSGFFSGPVVTSSTFCLNRSLGGPVTYPLDVNGDNVADICSLPTTRRATVARQNALERLAAERNTFFESLFASECARLITVTFGEGAEANDECADREAGTGRPLPGDDDEDDGGSGGGGGSGGDDGEDDGSEGSTGGTSGRDTGSGNRGTGPTSSVTAPKATVPGKYSNRAAQNVQLAAGDRAFTVSWTAVPVVSDEETPPDTDIYDSDEVFEYVVAYSTTTSMSNSQQVTLKTDGTVTVAPPGSEWTCTLATLSCEIRKLNNFTTYYVWVLANRGKSNSTGSGNNANLDYWTPTLSITPGLAGPPRWVDQDTAEDGVQGLVAGDYGEMRAFWQNPVEGAPSYYTLQWGSNQSFANNCNTSSNCEQKRVTSAPGAGELIEGLTNNRTYYVRVQGATSNGPGTWSLVQSLRLASNDPNPGKPTDVSLTSSGGGTTLVVTWTPPATNLPDDPAPTSYRVQWRNVSDNEGWDSTNRQESPTASPQNITGLDALDRYQVRVLAVTGKVAGPWSDIKEITLGRPGAPMITSIDAGTHDLAVTWTAPNSSPAANSIVLQYDTSSGFANNCAADASCNEMTLTWSSGATTPLSGLSSNTVYYIRMRSVNSNGVSAWSERQSGEPGTIDAPTSVNATAVTVSTNADYGKLNVSWSSGSETQKPDLTGFGMRYRRTGTTSWTTRTLNDFDHDAEPYNCNSADINGDIAAAPTTYSCTITGLLSDVSYDVQVRATNSYGSGQWSDTGTGTTASGKPDTPSTPAAADVASQSGSLRVTWTHTVTDPTPAVSSFEMRLCHTPSGSSTATCRTFGVGKTATTNTDEYQYTVTGLTNDTDYTVNVRARNTHGYSDWSGDGTGRPTNTN